MQARYRRTEAILLCAVPTAVSAALGLIALGRRSLWLDEVIDVNRSGLPWSDFIPMAFHQEASQALYLLFLKPWLAITSTDEWVARLPSVVFAASAASVLVALGMRLFRSRLVGFGAGLLLATNVTSVSWSQQARQYSLAMLLAVVVTYVFVWALESDRLVPWLMYGAVAGIAIYAHFFVGLVVASHAVALLVLWRRRIFEMWAIAMGVTLLIALPAFDFVMYHDTGQVDWIQDVTYQVIRSAVHQASGGTWLLPTIAAVGLVLLVIEAFRRRRFAWRHVLVASWLVVPLMLASAISYFKPILVERNLIVSLPALSLAVAYAISRLGRRVGSLALLVVVAASVTDVREWYREPVGQDWRSAVRYVEHTKRPDDQLLSYPGWLADPVTYYADSDVDTSETLRGDRAWAVVFWDRVGEAESWASEAGYSVASRRTFGQISVFLLTPADQHQ